MQPYFLPYLGYFALIRAADRFVAMDDVQYIRHGWVNRNRVLHPESGWQYIGVPLRKHSHRARIRDIVISDASWRVQLFRRLEHYRSSAPYYDDVIALLDRAINGSHKNLAPLNYELLRAVSTYLGIEFNGALWSELGIDLPEIEGAAALAMAMTQAMGASTYVNPIGGRELYHAREFAERSIGLEFLEMKEVIYDQKRPTFQPWLSIVDVLMFSSPDQARGFVDRYHVIKAQ